MFCKCFIKIPAFKFNLSSMHFFRASFIFMFISVPTLHICIVLRCCRICAKTVGETCGGPGEFSGQCEPPLLCVTKLPIFSGLGVCRGMSKVFGAEQQTYFEFNYKMDFPLQIYPTSNSSRMMPTPPPQHINIETTVQMIGQ